MALLEPFTAHPASVGETYVQHLGFASATGGKMVLAGLACMVHGIFPFLCTRTGSRAIIALHARVTAGARAHVAETTLAEERAAGRA